MGRRGSGRQRGGRVSWEDEGLNSLPFFDHKVSRIPQTPPRREGSGCLFLGGGLLKADFANENSSRPSQRGKNSPPHPHPPTF